MFAVILTGHGHFASGLHQAAKQIIGEQPAFQAVDFTEGCSTEQLTQQLEAAIAACDQGDGIVFLSDLLGGSPFRCASLLSMQRTDSQVFTGTNLPMLLELLLARDEMQLSEVHDWLLDCGHKAITSLAQQSQKSRQAQGADDGI